MHKIFTKNLIVGKKVVHLPKCHSTNTVASELATLQPANEGTVVITDHQLSGRGQRGNSWESEAGQNLTFSVILKPSFLKPQQQFDLTVIASLAVARALDAHGIANVLIKWPNDIYSGKKKIAGILIENVLRTAEIESSVVGIGINVNQQKFATDKATSVSLVTGKTVEKESILARTASCLEAAYLQLRAGRSQGLREEYLGRLMGKGSELVLRDGDGIFSAEISGVSEHGRLQVIRKGMLKEYDLKEIEFVL